MCVLRVLRVFTWCCASVLECGCVGAVWFVYLCAWCGGDVVVGVCDRAVADVS